MGITLFSRVNGDVLGLDFEVFFGISGEDVSQVSCKGPFVTYAVCVLCSIVSNTR